MLFEAVIFCIIIRIAMKEVNDRIVFLRMAVVTSGQINGDITIRAIAAQIALQQPAVDHDAPDVAFGDPGRLGKVLRWENE